MNWSDNIFNWAKKHEFINEKTVFAAGELRNFASLQPDFEVQKEDIKLIGE